MPALCVAILALNHCAPIKTNASAKEKGYEAAKFDNYEAQNRVFQTLIESPINLNEHLWKLKNQVENMNRDILIQHVRLDEIMGVVETLNDNIHRTNELEEDIDILNSVVDYLKENTQERLQNLETSLNEKIYSDTFYLDDMKWYINFMFDQKINELKEKNTIDFEINEDLF